MPWIKKEYRIKNFIYVERTFSTRYGKGWVCRSPNEKETSEKAARVNDRRKIKYMGLLANANFTEGDYFITYTFRRELRPACLDDCRELWRKYLRKLRDAYKKAGQPFKYMWCIESENCATHIHMLFNSDVPLRSLPPWPYGNPKIELLDDRKWHSIGEYISKENHRKKRDGEQAHTKKTMGTSRNLIRPQPKVTVLVSGRWPEKPRAPKGYYLDESSLENVVYENTFNGVMFPCQTCRFIKKE